jgi:hypothetical protein
MLDDLRYVASIMALIGVPSLFGCSVYFAKACIKFSEKVDILMNAQQKQMRRELTMDFHRYIEEGHIDDDDLDMWEASYQAYHSLGENGIMDSRRKELIKLNNKGRQHDSETDH